MKTKLFIIIALMSLFALHNEVKAQTDFYSLTKQEKEARAEELLKIDFETLQVNDATLQAYRNELKRFAEYYQSKADKQQSRAVWEFVGGILVPIAAVPILALASVPAGVALLAGGIYLLVDGTRLMFNNKNEQLSKQFYEKIQDAL